MTEEIEPVEDHTNYIGLRYTSEDDGVEYVIVNTTELHAEVKKVSIKNEPVFMRRWSEIFPLLFQLKPMCLAIVQVDLAGEGSKRMPFKNGDTVLYLGELGNMPDHCVVATEDGLLWWGYHTERFRAARPDEV